MEETSQRQVQPSGTKLLLSVNRNQLPSEAEVLLLLLKIHPKDCATPQRMARETFTQEGFLIKTHLDFTSVWTAHLLFQRYYFLMWPSNFWLCMRAHHTNLCSCSYLLSFRVFIVSASEDDLMVLTFCFCPWSLLTCYPIPSNIQ